MRSKGILSLTSALLIVFGLSVLFSFAVPIEDDSSAERVGQEGKISGEIYSPTFEEQLEEESRLDSRSDGDSQVKKGSLVFVEKVIDGDTIEIEGGQRVRYIGIDTPETVDPRKGVQCYGKEASNKNKQLVEGEKVYLEKDVSETDKYGRLLRYIWLPSTSSGQVILVNEILVREGYAYSSSYPPDIKYQERFDEAQRFAQKNRKRLWGVCGSVSGVEINQSQLSSNDCQIKGNISSRGSKIYHLPGQKYYGKTVIDEDKGERWFCSEKEAISAGWRKSRI